MEKKLFASICYVWDCVQIQNIASALEVSNTTVCCTFNTIFNINGAYSWVQLYVSQLWLFRVVTLLQCTKYLVDLHRDTHIWWQHPWWLSPINCSQITYCRPSLWDGNTFHILCIDLLQSVWHLRAVLHIEGFHKKYWSRQVGTMSCKSWHWFIVTELIMALCLPLWDPIIAHTVNGGWFWNVTISDECSCT